MRACLRGKGRRGQRPQSCRAAGADLSRPRRSRPILKFLRTLAGFDSDLGRRGGRVGGGSGRGGRRRSGRARRRGLRRVLEPPRLRLLTQFTAIPAGIKFLVDLRAFLLAAGPGRSAARGARGSISIRLLASWFDVGLLALRRITGPAPPRRSKSWSGTRRCTRSGRGRPQEPPRHRPALLRLLPPRMPNEPLIFVEVALVRGLADSVQRLLDRRGRRCSIPGEADTAIFYSISNCQGRPRRHQLRQFSHQARRAGCWRPSFLNLRTFATLSPIPGFRAMAGGRCSGPCEEPDFFSERRKPPA